jgi:2-succinyl-6-hydroxy-2,4-cyclohexadiene-1-carboxylate synthase
MQRADAWAPVAARVAERRPIALVDLPEPSLDASVDRILAGARGGAVVGYSMGGRIALHAAVRHPGALRALVLVGATPGMDDDDARRSRRAADDELAGWMESRPIEAIVDRWESQTVFATQDPALVAAQRPGRLSHDPRTLAAMLRATGQGVLDPLWDRLGGLTIPVLAVAGEHDTKYAALAERIASTLPRARVALVPGAGHAPQLEQPEAFSALLLDFLDEHLGQDVGVDRDA